MREKINQLAKGLIAYELPRIVLGSEKLNITVEAGKKYAGRVTISNDAGKPMKGICCSDDAVLSVQTQQFVGVENTIEYVVHAENLPEGTVCKGEMNLITDCGETALPYKVTVTAPTLASADGSIYNLTQFAMLARNHWTEAERLYADEAFLPFLRYHEPEQVFLLKTLQKSTSLSRSLEEFLVAAGKKMWVTLEADKKQLEYEVGSSAFTDRIVLTKNNWGYVNLQVSSTAPFLSVEHDVVTMEHFQGNTYDVKFVVMPDKMQYGNNFGSLVVEAQNQRIEIAVTCHKPHPDKQEWEERKRCRQLQARLLENYLEYEMNQIPVGRYIAEAESILARLEPYYPENPLEMRLYQIHLNRMGGKESPANAMLRAIREEEVEKASINCRAAYLYLKAERSTTIRVEMMEQLYELCGESDKQTIPALLLLRLDERYQKNRKLRLEELRSIHEKGSRSPLVYFEAAKLYNEEPTLLHGIGPFEAQTIAFAVRNQYLQKEAARQYSYLAEHEKEVRFGDYYVLAAMYERFQLKETLSAICQLLIRSHCRDNRYHIWYQRGIEEQLRIPELYEYDMYTREQDMEEELDPAILMYFAYNNKLNARKLSYLYANIVLHKDNHASVYETYREKIQKYTEEQAQAGNCDACLSVLYHQALADAKMRGEMLDQLSKTAFRHEIHCHTPGMHYVCVAHKELAQEMVVPLVGGIAQVDLYSDNYLLAFMDDNHNRFVRGIAYEDVKLMHEEELFPEAYARNQESSMLLLWLTEKAQKEKKFDPEAIELRKKACSLSELNPEFREELIRTLLLYYYDNFQDARLKDSLKQLNLSEIPLKQRARLTGLLILHGDQERAMEMLSSYGYQEVDIRLLERFCTTYDGEAYQNRTPFMTSLMYFVFSHGRRNERIVRYLAANYQGTTLAMYHLWQEAVAKKLEVRELNERLLAQILFTESYLPYGEELFLCYLDAKSNRQLTRAYMAYVSYKYLVSDIAIGEAVIQCMKKEVYSYEQDVCVMALLKYWSEAKNLDKTEQDMAEYWLVRMEAKGKILPNFLKLGRYFALPESLEDKQLIEYRTNPNHRVTLHYSFRIAGKRQQREVPMRNVCYGIFVKELVLFLYESMEYVISDEDEEHRLVTEKTVLTIKEDQLPASHSRYAQINAVIAARQAEDKEKAIELIDQYVKDEFAISQLFHEMTR